MIFFGVIFFVVRPNKHLHLDILSNFYPPGSCKSETPRGLQEPSVRTIQTQQGGRSLSSCLPTKWRDQEFDSGVEGQAEWKGFFAPPPLLQPASAYLGPACRADPLHSSPRSVSTKGGSGSPHHTALHRQAATLDQATHAIAQR